MAFLKSGISLKDSASIIKNRGSVNESKLGYAVQLKDDNDKIVTLIAQHIRRLTR